MARAKTREEIETADILAIHKTILQKINDAWAEVFRNIPVRVVGSTIPCPNYVKVPSLVDELTVTIRHSQEHPATIAAYAHLQLAAIHPFCRW